MKRWMCWLACALVAPSVVLAGSTQKFSINTVEMFEKGKVDGAAVHGSGKLTRAVRVKRTAVESAGVAYASTEGPDGAIYVASGNEGIVYRVAPGGAVTPFAKTPAALVTSLAWNGKTLYAGTLPGGRVYAIDPQGKVRELAALTDADHVWALAFDAQKSTLYAATGPTGKLFAIDPVGHAKLLHDDAAEHLLSLGLDAEGTLYAGTSNGARLLRVRAGKTEVLYDADAEEITALAVGPGFVAIAANDFPNPPATTPDGPRDASAAGRARRPKPGKGKVIRVGFDGLARELLQNDSMHISALDIEASGRAIQVGLASEGHLVRVTDSGERARWADADERQVVAIHLHGDHPHFLTSDGVAVYTIDKANTEGTWTSHPLDAKARARFGELLVRKQGTVHIATRSGNTEPPDASWTPWSAERANDGPIGSPEGRFLQLRVALVGEAELYAIDAFYLPQNLPAFVRNVRVSEPKLDAKGQTAASAQMTVHWDVDNPDQDRLRYRVSFRREGQTTAVPMLKCQEVLERNETVWDTSQVPDGYYRLEVEASDELTTPAPQVLKTQALSAPVLVDHRAPEIVSFTAQGTGSIAGRVRDGLGPILRLELSVDGDPFLPLSSDDGLLDEREEAFAAALSPLPAGPHLLTLRVLDAAENVGTQTIEWVVR